MLTLPPKSLTVRRCRILTQQLQFIGTLFILTRREIRVQMQGIKSHTAAHPLSRWSSKRKKKNRRLKESQNKTVRWPKPSRLSCENLFKDRYSFRSRRTKTPFMTKYSSSFRAECWLWARTASTNFQEWSAFLVRTLLSTIQTRSLATSSRSSSTEDNSFCRALQLWSKLSFRIVTCSWSQNYSTHVRKTTKI